MTLKIIYVAWVVLSLPYFVYRMRRIMLSSWTPGKPTRRAHVILALMAIVIVAFDVFVYLLVFTDKLQYWLEGDSYPDLLWAFGLVGLAVSWLILARKVPRQF